jgi:hypothetical protein
MAWYHIPYKEGKWGTTRIFKQDGITFLGNDASDYWFSNGLYAELGIQGQRLMWHAAKGNVLCCLGMGILPMLCALKPEVTSVTAIEIDKNIIDAFNEQGFDTTKIDIINIDMLDLEDISKFDTIFLDAAKVQDEFFEKHKEVLKNKTIILQGWEHEYIQWIGKHKFGKYSLEAYDEFAKEKFMPQLTQEQLDDYVGKYYSKYYKLFLDGKLGLIHDGQLKWVDVMESLNTPIDEELVEALKTIDSKRLIKI